MEEKLIEFETAKLAKEKGFNIPCDGRWWIEPASDWKFSKQGVIKCDNSMDSIARPTQSLLQKWLREVHNLHIGMHYDCSIIGGYIITDIIKSVEPRFINQVNKKSKYENYKTYEEALEVGLLEALKLIGWKNN